MFYQVWLLSFSILFSRFIHIVSVSRLISFIAWIVFRCIHMSHFSVSFPQLVDIWIVSIFWTVMLWMLLWTLMAQLSVWTYSLNSLEYTYLGVEFAGTYGHMVTLTFWGTVRLLAKAAAPLTFPLALYQGSSFGTSFLTPVNVYLLGSSIFRMWSNISL